jgi:putative FmdB family regulatory protein
MPTYGYRCSHCGHEFEVFQSISAAPLRLCPECGGELRKLLYPVGVQFKGSGFYSTDYKNGSGRSKKPEQAKEAKEPSGSSADKSDSGEKKPAPAAKD